MAKTDGFGTGRLFFADSQLALAVLNSGRYWALNRLFGFSRQQANVVTFFLTVLAAEAAYESGRRMVRGPHVSRGDAAVGLLALREGALSLAGPEARQTPYAGALLAFAMLGGIAVPRLRRGTQSLRAAEQRVRSQRIGRYVAATRSGSETG
jgi:hypothetical protein